MSENIAFDPLFPLWGIAILTVFAVCASLLRASKHPAGTALRLLTIAAIAAFLMGPTRTQVDATPLTDIGLIVVDHSRSTAFGDRREIIDAAAADLEAALLQKGLDVRRIEMLGTDRTEFGKALKSALMDVPRDRLSAITVVSDGRIHGAFAPPADVPLHALLAGDPQQQIDRRIDIVRAPRFGVVDETVEVVLRVESENEAGSLASTLLVNGQPFATQDLPLGEDVTVTVPLPQPGETIIELDVEARPDELTALNNRAVVELTAVRDRLRVLLVSGEPHAGERVWRNTLKSDPAVDLVHFTILKPGNKIAIAAPEEVNLIEFPHEELFLEKLRSFDVVIFDRYTYRGVLQDFEFQEIARYVEQGGAVLIAAGPEMATEGSLASHPSIAYLLPVLASAQAVEKEFLPTLTEVGRRHPVTASLPDPESWGRWVRRLPGAVRRGEVVLADEAGNPLLVLDRVRKGRIAVLLSDQIWLWAREFDGGGPHRELLRRLLHWLMQEPELEEESLTGKLRNGQLIIERHTLSDAVAPVTIQPPDSGQQTISLEPDGEGRFRATLAAKEIGLFRLSTTTDAGEPLYALAHDGLADNLETRAVTTTDAVLRDAVASSGGLIAFLDTPGASLPRVRRGMPTGQTPSDMAFPARNARIVTSFQSQPLLPAWGWLILMAALIIGAWFAEGQTRKS